MFSENGTEIAHGNQSVSIDITTLSEDDFGVFNCTAENAEGIADYMVELTQAGIQKKITWPLNFLIYQGSQGNNEIVDTSVDIIW